MKKQILENARIIYSMDYEEIKEIYQAKHTCDRCGVPINIGHLVADQNLLVCTECLNKILKLNIHVDIEYQEEVCRVMEKNYMEKLPCKEKVGF